MQEINLYRLVRFYVRNWLLILSLTLAGLLGGLVYNTFVQVPLYKSDATLLFINSAGSSSTQDVTKINNYVELFKSRRVLEPVLNDQKLDMSYDQIAASVSAANEKGTEVIKLSVSTDNPDDSRKFLRAAVVSFKSEAKDLYGTDNLSIVDNASSAIPPYNVNKLMQLAISTAIGFVVSLIVLFFIYDIKGDAIKKRVRKPIAQKKKSSKAARTTEPAFIRAKNSIISWVTNMRTKLAKPTKPTVKPVVKKTPVKKSQKTTPATTKGTAKAVAKKPAAKKTVAKKSTTKKTTTK